MNVFRKWTAGGEIFNDFAVPDIIFLSKTLTLRRYISKISPAGLSNPLHNRNLNSLRVDSKSAQNSTRGNSLRVDSIFQIRAAEYVR